MEPALVIDVTSCVWLSLKRVYWTSLVVCTICFQRNEMCVTDFDISPNSIYQQQELYVLVTASLCMDLTITYNKYQSPVSNDINILCCVCFYFVALDVSLGFHFILCVCYVNPAYGCQIEINCVLIKFTPIPTFRWKLITLISIFHFLAFSTMIIP